MNLSANRFPRVLAQELIERVTQQLRHVGVRVGDSSIRVVKNQYAVACAFEQTAITKFGAPHRFRHPFESLFGGFALADVAADPVRYTFLDNREV